MQTTETPKNQFAKGLAISGAILMIPMLLLVLRIVFEETWLTFRQGPQMVGFSLVHGTWAPLVLAPVALLVWLLIALVTVVVVLARRRGLWKPLVITMTTAIVLMGVLSLPAPFWQWVFIGTFARSPHAPGLMVYVAAGGYTRTVRGYLDHGVPLESKNYEGSNAAFAAAAGGHVPLLALLASRGADLNATNLYGDSPLEAAVENHESNAADYLRQHGAKQVKGTEEQRQAAARAIAEKAMHGPGTI